jgi:hypothetical protein
MEVFTYTEKLLLYDFVAFWSAPLKLTHEICVIHIKYNYIIMCGSTCIYLFISGFVDYNFVKFLKQYFEHLEYCVVQCLKGFNTIK